MNRRQIMASALAFPASGLALAGSENWSYRILNGGFDGTAYSLGLHVVLAKGWKTYWRSPGSGGIPPSIEVTGSNIASSNFDCPLPQRFRGEDGETIGYKHEVVFPIHVTPLDPGKPVEAAIGAFLGVCDVICIPAKIDEIVQLKPVKGKTADYMLWQNWVDRVPLISKATINVTAVGTTLELSLNQPADDVFIEFLDGIPHFAPKPVFSATRNFAAIEIKGASNEADLRGRKIRITIVLNGKGLEEDRLVL